MTATDRLVSVVMPVWNGERYLREAIASVLEQDCPKELIVVDDGSTDGTAAILRELAPSLTVVRQEHAGTATARNAGLTRARGELVTQMDSDDVMPASALRARVAALLARPELEAVSGHVQQFYSPDLAPELRARLRCPEEPQPARIVTTMVVRRAAFERVGSFDASPSARAQSELDWCLRAQDAGLRILVLPDVVLRRRVHATNASHLATRAPAQLALLKAALDRRRREGTS